MRIVIDLDGTICKIKQPGQLYSELEPTEGAISFLQTLRENGHYIIIQTARNMATCESNLGKVMKNIGKTTLDWLEQHQVPYDEIYFGKPNAHLYIDDRALRHNSWQELSVADLEVLAKER
ncbi:MAG: HAD hydrolase family protein [Saprospiraceae bacterium]